MALIQSATKLYDYAKTLQADKLKLAQDLAAALADDKADDEAIAAAKAKVTELQAQVDAGVGVDTEDEAALSASIEMLITESAAPAI